MAKQLLICGILSSVLYVLMNIFVPLYFEGYSVSAQTVSELSAIDAPTRPLWVSLAIVYILLVAAFGWGVSQSAYGNRHLRIAARLIFIYVIINFYWPPMHLRGNEPTLTDTLHIVWAMVTLVLMMFIMGFGAAALGKSFRLYTVVTFVVFIAFGILIGTEAPGIPKNTPTPRIGIWERINIGAYMLWVIVFAIVLLRKQKVEMMNMKRARQFYHNIKTPE
jgi:amino acid transporter